MSRGVCSVVLALVMGVFGLVLSTCVTTQDVAAETSGEAEVNEVINSNLPKSGDKVLINVLNAIYGVAGIVAVIYVIVAGIQYVTSNGDPGKAAKALHMIIYALVGLVIVIVAAALTNFVFGSI